MYFHEDRDSSNPAPIVHERFVATNGTGLNFNDPISSNGEPGHGPVEVTVLTDEGLTRDVWIGNDERLNPVDVNLLPNDLLEVFFYVKEASRSSPDDFNAIYRLVYDIRDDDFQNWTIARDTSGQAIQAPGTSRVDLPSDSHDAIATLEVIFPETGTYIAYYRAYGVSGTTNSFYAPTGFGVEPTINQTTDGDGVFTWTTGEHFTVWPSDVGISLEIQLGRRERDNR